MVVVRPQDKDRPSSCNADYACAAGDCPSFLTVVPSGRRPGQREVDVLSGADLTVRITGVGGTGIVTVAQIHATAAVTVGKRVRALDQTGLAQRAAPTSRTSGSPQPSSTRPRNRPTRSAISAWAATR